MRIPMEYRATWTIYEQVTRWVDLEIWKNCHSQALESCQKRARYSEIQLWIGDRYSVWGFVWPSMED